MEAATATTDGGAPEAKRARTGTGNEEPEGTMPAKLREQIKASIAAIGQVEYRRRPHFPTQRFVARENRDNTNRQRTASPFRMLCKHCRELIRNDKWDTHVVKMMSDLHLQESAVEC